MRRKDRLWLLWLFGLMFGVNSLGLLRALIGWEVALAIMAAVGAACGIYVSRILARNLASPRSDTRDASDV